MSISRPTLRDVAQKAGVSHQTVSRVINGSLDVLPETRALVEAAIAEMGYRPNAIAVRWHADKAIPWLASPPT